MEVNARPAGLHSGEGQWGRIEATREETCVCVCVFSLGTRGIDPKFPA